MSGTGIDPEWLTAHLDGELDDEDAARVEAALAADPDLAAEYRALAEVRTALRDAAVTMPPDVLDRIVARVAAADESGDPADESEAAAPVVPLVRRRRRRMRIALAAAAVTVIVVGVVGGVVGGPASLPAVGDLVARHEAAAAVLEGTMPDEEMAAMMADEMPMDEAMADAPPMPADLHIRYAFREGSTVQLVYESDTGDAVSVFRHDGETDLSDLEGGEMHASPAGEMWTGPVDDAHVSVVDGEGYVWVVVTEDDTDEMMDVMMDDLPARSPSLAERVGDAARRITDAVTFWD